jgi:centromeric protein E
VSLCLIDIDFDL